MAQRLLPYGEFENGALLSKVGNVKPIKLSTPGSLAARMPSAEIAAKVGDKGTRCRTHRVVRKNAAS